MLYAVGMDGSRLDIDLDAYEMVKAVPYEQYEAIYKDFEGGETLHLTTYPETKSEYETDVSQMDVALEILKNVRGLRTDRKVGNGAKLETLTIPATTPDVLHGLIKSAARANEIILGDELDFVVAEQKQ